MVSFLISAFGFIKNNVVPLLIATAVSVFLFFVISFFIVRGKLHDAEAELALTKLRIVQLEKDVKDITKTHIDLSHQVDEYKQKSDDLARQLERRGKKSISELARKKAKLVEKAINRGTEQVLKCVEIITNGGDC